MLFLCFLWWQVFLYQRSLSIITISDVHDDAKLELIPTCPGKGKGLIWKVNVSCTDPHSLPSFLRRHVSHASPSNWMYACKMILAYSCRVETCRHSCKVVEAETLCVNILNCIRCPVFLLFGCTGGRECKSFSSLSHSSFPVSNHQKSESYHWRTHQFWSWLPREQLELFEPAEAAVPITPKWANESEGGQTMYHIMYGEGGMLMCFFQSFRHSSPPFQHEEHIATCNLVMLPFWRYLETECFCAKFKFGLNG